MTRATRAGFTLLEVLVSLAMVGVAAVVLGTAYVNVLFNYHAMQGRAAEEADATHVRGLVMAEPQRAVAEGGGRMERPGGGSVRWETRIEETAQPDLFRVAVEMEFIPATTAAPRARREEFLLLRPTWSDPEKREALRAAFREKLERRKRT
ncbi:MAG TPA: prepilin-type N-terminal cleavage/methylation domain-containing protein [Opitutaceae bacterium]|nr:prepilin-type N-terminal cleavage/methylation domain-containing protein [Opitutaceae bacterium]